MKLFGQAGLQHTCAGDVGLYQDGNVHVIVVSISDLMLPICTRIHHCSVCNLR